MRRRSSQIVELALLGGLLLVVAAAGRWLVRDLVSVPSLPGPEPRRGPRRARPGPPCRRHESLVQTWTLIRFLHLVGIAFFVGGKLLLLAAATPSA